MTIKGPADSQTLPFATALASVAGLPDEAIEALWTANQVVVSGHSDFCPVDPGQAVAANVLHAAGGGQLAALAAATRDSGVLDAVVAKAQADGDTEALVHAATNPYLSEAAYNCLSGEPDVHSVLAPRRAVRASMASLATNPGLTENVATELVEAYEGVLATHLVATDRNPATLGGYVWDALVGAYWGAAGTVHRKVRDAVLTLSDPTTRQMMVVESAKCDGAPITPTLAKAIVEAIDAGALLIGDVTATLDSPAHAWCQLAGGTAAELAAIQYPVVKHTRDENLAKSRKAAGQLDTAADEAALLAALGCGEAAARTLFSDDMPVPQEQLDEALDNADVETVVDWAERRLSRIPATGEVVQQLARMSLDRLHEVADEVARRPEPLSVNAELVLVLPGVSSLGVGSRPAQEAAKFLAGEVGNDHAAWTVAVTLIGDGFEGTLVELAAAANAVTNP